jgi:HEAT repeats
MPSPLESLAYRDRPIADRLRQLSDSDPDVRGEAISTLADAAAGLSVLLRDLAAAVRTVDHPASRVAMLTALGRVGAQTQAAVAAVHANVKDVVLSDPTEDVRTAGVQALTVLGPRAKSEVHALVASLRDELADIRAGAARMLGERGTDAREAVSALIPLSQYDPDPRVRVEGAAALWRIDRHPGRVIPTLIESLGVADELVRWVAADCLGDIGPDALAAAPALRAALAKPYRAGLIRVGLQLALERIVLSVD